MFLSLMMERICFFSLDFVNFLRNGTIADFALPVMMLMGSLLFRLCESRMDVG